MTCYANRCALEMWLQSAAPKHAGIAAGFSQQRVFHQKKLAHQTALLSRKGGQRDVFRQLQLAIGNCCELGV
ncbi:MAG: hypothetical protein CL678_00310 [Bdellovibrionaceae bacterium]|nr:hypothetical protein [Pseudobdellovibrionaceae bacterium]